MSMNTAHGNQAVTILGINEQKNYESIIEDLIYENNKKDVIIISLQKKIKNLEIKNFSASVPPKAAAKPQVKAAAKPQVKVTLKRDSFRRIVANILQKSILFCEKFAKSEHSQRKLRKLSTAPYAYFADSKYAFLRPFCKLFDD